MVNQIVLCKTKAGKGMKICVNGTWFYSSLTEVSKLFTNKAKACTFRTIAQKATVPAVVPQSTEGGVQ